jgi:hypothetical protein
MNEPTKRQQLISQARGMLRDLQSPAYFDTNETLLFTIGDMDFEYTEENLEEQAS